MKGFEAKAIYFWINVFTSQEINHSVVMRRDGSLLCTSSGDITTILYCLYRLYLPYITAYCERATGFVPLLTLIGEGLNI